MMKINIDKQGKINKMKQQVINGEFPATEQVNPHLYNLTEFTISEQGLVPVDQHMKMVVRLLRGSKVEGENTIPKQDGFLTEQLLWIAKTYLEEVNVGDMRTRDTSIAITHIEDALLRLGKRTQDRKDRGVLSSYNK